MTSERMQRLAELAGLPGEPDPRGAWRACEAPPGWHAGWRPKTGPGSGGWRRCCEPGS